MSSAAISEAFAQWGNTEPWPQFQSVQQEADASGRPRASSFTESEARQVSSIDAVMEEFRRNGHDSPYDPEEELDLYRYENSGLSGMGPPGAYLRQKSWPAPDATPALPVPGPRSFRRQGFEEVMAPSGPVSSIDAVMEEFRRNGHDSPYDPEEELDLYRYENSGLSGLGPPGAYLRQKSWPAPDATPALPVPGPRSFRRQGFEEMIECRFCKNNGEMESKYRSHRLRWQGRVVCPVLRAYRCRRCGARGDNAHTLKYCPLTTDDERMKSTNMMRSIRQSSSYRRNWQRQAPSNDGAGYYDVNPTVMRDGAAYNMAEPLDPMWEDLARKLMF